MILKNIKPALIIKVVKQTWSKAYSSGILSTRPSGISTTP